MVASVSKAFYDVLATEQQIKVVNENIVGLERSLKDARAQYDVGIAAKTDFCDAHVVCIDHKIILW